MIGATIDTRSLGKQIANAARAFGEENEAAIARWGVSTARRLVIETQAFGDGKEAFDKQKKAILKDAQRVIGVVKDASETRLVNKGFTRKRKILRSAKAVNDFIDNLRRGKRKKPPKIDKKYKAVTSQRHFDSAMNARFRRIWKGKGGWIGAGMEIARYQRGKGRITIGKNFAGRAHKWKKGGNSKMRKSRWEPEGKLNNTYPHVAIDYVLNRSGMQKAVNDGGKNTLEWYNRTMAARLRKL